MNNFQRVGAISNAHVGKEFEKIAHNYFKSIKFNVEENYSIPLGIGEFKKSHLFDLGGLNHEDNPFVVECKSHT